MGFFSRLFRVLNRGASDQAAVDQAAVIDCVLDACTDQIAGVRSIPHQLKIDAVAEVEKRTAFFMLFNYDLRLHQLCEEGATSEIIAKVTPKISKMLGMALDDFTVQYNQYAKVFYHLLQAYESRAAEDDDRLAVLGKRLCIVITQGIRAWQRYEQADFDNRPIEEVDMALDGGVISTIHGMSYTQSIVSIGKFCKGVSGLGFRL